jgi:hypothetical protein
VENGINLEVIWFDEVEDFLEVVFSCSNGYSGRAEIYVTRDGLAKFANTLRGFPLCPNECRDFELGTFNADHARMHFFCEDAAGHAVVEVKLHGDACKVVGEMESVALRIPIQAAGVDDFTKQLWGVGKTIGASAFLRQATS